LSRRALRTDPENAGADPPSLTIMLTREQQLEVLAATGLMVSTLELPLEAVVEGGEALARLPLPDWLKEREIRPKGKGVNEDDPVGERGSDQD
jgi:hypothetical protein